MLTFVATHNEKLIIWCLTGGGDLFEENYRAFKDLLEKKYTIIAVFSNAGALIYNRYGFFWEMSKFVKNKENLLFLFEDPETLTFNIQKLLDNSKILYAILPSDPSFARGIWLANQKVKCIIGSPFTANSVGKLVHGIADNLILNIISTGKKANQTIGIFPTDRGMIVIESKLPVRQVKPLPKTEYDSNTCKYNALGEHNSLYIEFKPEYCVGCRNCVNLYPANFSVNEKINIKIRTIDHRNSMKLSKEFQVFQSPDEISKFILSLDD
ncbi:MAG: flavoprotein [Candidatus Hodarchaeales archaeon]